MQQVDQVDLGIVQVLLTDEEEEAPVRLCDCLLALDAAARHLALAHRGKLLLLQQSSSESGPPRPLGLPEADDARSLCWFASGAAPPVLLVGCASGRLCAFSSSGERLLAVRLHHSPLVHIHAQAARGDEPEVLCLFGGGTIGCARAESMRVALGLHSDGSIDASAPSELDERRRRSAAAGGPLFGLFELAIEAEGCHSVVCCGSLPHLPLDLDLDDAAAPPPDGRGAVGSEPPGPSPRSIALVVAHSSSLQLHLMDPPHAPRAAAASAVVGYVAARGLGALSSLTGSLFGGAPKAEQPPREPAPPPPPPISSRVGETSCVRALADSPRSFLTLALEPRRRWLAVTDSLGRVALLEPKSLVLLRLWKGYRDAQCGWTDAAAANCVCEAGGCTTASLLVIYAPRRGLIEVWRAPSGGRVYACNVGADCVLAAPQPPPGSASASGRGGGDDADDAPSMASPPQLGDHHPRCFLLHRGGVLSLVRAP